MTDDVNTDCTGNFQKFPDSPELALICAMTYQKLGAQFVMFNHVRSISIPLCTHAIGGMPQMKGARPHEKFYDDKEYRGAMKLLGYFVSRLSEADKEFVWTMLASDRLSPDGDFDFRDYLAN